MKTRSFLIAFALLSTIGIQQLKAQTVFVTSTGKKYHTKDCDLLKEGGGKIKGISLAEAKKQGYEPCKPCKADEIVPIEEKKRKAAQKSN